MTDRSVAAEFEPGAEATVDLRKVWGFPQKTERVHWALEVKAFADGDSWLLFSHGTNTPKQGLSIRWHRSRGREYRLRGSYVFEGQAVPLPNVTP